MKFLRLYAVDIIVFLLVLLWIYTASSKLMEFHKFRAQMHNQTIPRALSDLLIYTLPAIEIGTALLLLFKNTKLAGFYLSAILMFMFTGYVGLVLTNYFGRIPCSCGGVIKKMSWVTHFIFNLIFLLLSVYGSYCLYRERRHGQIL